MEKGLSSLGLSEPFRKIMWSSCFLVPETGKAFRRLCKSRRTSVDDCPAPMTAIRSGSEVGGKEEKKASAEEMYEEVWMIRGCGHRTDKAGGSFGDPPGEITILPKTG